MLLAVRGRFFFFAEFSWKSRLLFYCFQSRNSSWNREAEMVHCLCELFWKHWCVCVCVRVSYTHVYKFFHDSALEQLGQFPFRPLSIACWLVYRWVTVLGFQEQHTEQLKYNIIGITQYRAVPKRWSTIELHNSSNSHRNRNIDVQYPYRKRWPSHISIFWNSTQPCAAYFE
jgi:hypothetical protein